MNFKETGEYSFTVKINRERDHATIIYGGITQVIIPKGLKLLDITCTYCKQTIGILTQEIESFHHKCRKST